MERKNVCGQLPLLGFGEEQSGAIIPVFDPIYFALLLEESDARREYGTIIFPSLLLLVFKGGAFRGALEVLLKPMELITRDLLLDFQVFEIVPIQLGEVEPHLG